MTEHRDDAPDSTGREKFFTRAAGMTAFDGLLAALAQSFADKSERELSSIISSAREQTGFLDSKPMARVLRRSGLRLGRIKKRRTTVYFCLPAGRLSTHSRWMRLVVTLGLLELEKSQDRPEYPVILMLEEFASLKRLEAIERAAGFFAGFGVRLWTVLQDLSQLKSNYPQSWETFLGSAGIIQAFGNSDVTTTEYLSRLLGTTTIVQQQKVWVSGSAMAHGDTGLRENLRDVRLLDPSEVMRHFARETNRQLLISPGSLPVYCDRLPINFDVKGETS